MNKILLFLQTKIGISLITAIIIVGLAIGLKYRNTVVDEASKARGLLVENIISNSLSNVNQLDQAGYQFATSSNDDSATTSSQPEVTYTPTDKFSQEIFREYISAKQSGQDINPDLSSKIADSVLTQDYSGSEAMYSAADVKISGNNSISGLKTYGNSLGTILSTPTAAKESEMFVFEKITTEPLDGYVSELTAINKRYSAMKSKLLALPVPINLATSHASILNALTILIESVNGALALDTDPVGALTKISRYQDGLNILNLALEATKEYFAKQNVVFTPRESGYLLTR